MREKTQKRLFDNFFWHFIYLLPLLIWLVVSFQSGQITTLSGAFTSMGLEVFVDNPIYTSLMEVFATTGILPLFNSPDIVMYFTYFTSVFLMHLFVDFILFIPLHSNSWNK